MENSDSHGREIKYLVKFVSKIKYAEELVSGKLFMRPASYYHTVECGQGDLREAAISDRAQIYLNPNLPIFCTYTIYEDELVNGRALVSERCIIDFHCKTGYAIVISYDAFESRIRSINREEYGLCYGPITYRRISIEEFGTLVKDKTCTNLFIKHPYYSYQKEFWIVVKKPVYSFDEEPKDYVYYWLNGDLSSSSKILCISDFHSENGYYCVPVL